MEQTALRPKPMPRQEPQAGGKPGPAHHPHAARRRGRRLRTLLFGAFTGTLLVLSGVGVGTVGATVISMNRLAELRRQDPPTAPSTPAGPTSAPSATRAAPGATLGVEAVDDGTPGALVVGVHVPGPGYTAGLVRGDVLLQFGATRIDTAADLARAVAHAGPGKGVPLTVRHSSGDLQQLRVVPGVVT